MMTDQYQQQHEEELQRIMDTFEVNIPGMINTLVKLDHEYRNNPSETDNADMPEPQR